MRPPAEATRDRDRDPTSVAIECMTEDLAEARGYAMDAVVALAGRGVRLTALVERSDAIAAETRGLLGVTPEEGVGARALAKVHSVYMALPAMPPALVRPLASFMEAAMLSGYALELVARRVYSCVGTGCVVGVMGFVGIGVWLVW
jgi:hypothetical protein